MGRDDTTRARTAEARWGCGGRCRRDRRRFYRPVHCATFARSGRGCRHHRGDAAGLGRIGPQQRPGHPHAVAARPGGHHRKTWGGRRTLRRAVARQRIDIVRCRAALSNSGRAGTVGMGAAGAFAGAHQNRRTPGAAVVEIWCAGRVAVARTDPRHARLRCMVWRLLEQERRSYQSARAVARPGARCSRTRRPDLHPLARRQLCAAQQSMGGQDSGRTDQRPGVDRGHQCLYRRVLEIAGA